jgi:hypothetical protein
MMVSHNIIGATAERTLSLLMIAEKGSPLMMSSLNNIGAIAVGSHFA